jgi:hypothetical protein
MDDYSDFAGDDFFDTHDFDDLVAWEEEQVFQDTCAEREDFSCEDECDYDECEEGCE